MKCDLKKYLVKSKSLKMVKILDFCYQAFSAVEYLHRIKIIHGDIAARNFLVSQDEKCIKVADFGQSTTHIYTDSSTVDFKSTAYGHTHTSSHEITTLKARHLVNNV